MKYKLIRLYKAKLPLLQKCKAWRIKTFKTKLWYRVTKHGRKAKRTGYFSGRQTAENSLPFCYIKLVKQKLNEGRIIKSPSLLDQGNLSVIIIKNIIGFLEGVSVNMEKIAT